MPTVATRISSSNILSLQVQLGSCRTRESAGEIAQMVAQLRRIVRLEVGAASVKDDIQPTYRVTIPDEGAPLAGGRPTSGKVETAGIEPAQRSRRDRD